MGLILRRLFLFNIILLLPAGFSQGFNQALTKAIFPGLSIQEFQWRSGVGPRPERLVLKKGEGSDRTIYRFPKLADQAFYAACGSFHYNPDSPDWIDAYAHPKTGCALLYLVQKWRTQFCPSNELGCRMAWGDISHIREKYFSGHKTHTHGYCVDIRPFRKGAFANAPLWYTDENYDQQVTRSFLKLIKNEFAATPIYFNDPVLVKEGLARSKSGHENHIHFCFQPNDASVRKCKAFSLNREACPYFAENLME